MPSILIGVDIDGKVTQWNKTAEKSTGIKASEAHGKTLESVFPIKADLDLLFRPRRALPLPQEVQRDHAPLIPSLMNLLMPGPTSSRFTPRRRGTPGR